MDDAAVLEFFAANSSKDAKDFTEAFLAREDFFGQNLNEIEGLTDEVSEYLDDIRKLGMREAIRKNL